jgi:hypothetical protein
MRIVAEYPAGQLREDRHVEAAHDLRSIDLQRSRVCHQAVCTSPAASADITPSATAVLKKGD